MSKFSMNIYLNAYNDHYPSNNPGRSEFKWARDLNSIFVDNPTSQSATVAPGETLDLFDGMRTLDQDDTTQYSIALKPMTTTTYVITNVGGTAPNFRVPRSTGADANSQLTATTNGPIVTFSGDSVGITAAYFTGELTGMTSPVTITATVAGTGGNAISIPTDGASNINTLILNWNTNNPTLLVSLTAGDGNQIPATSQNFALAGGTSSDAIDLTGVQVGDTVFIGSNFNSLNQGFFTIIAFTATSFTVENPAGYNEGPILLGANFATQVQIYSAAGVQVEDTLVISGGFSLATQGAYEITAVYANSLEFSSTSGLPTEGPITTEAITIYSDAKSLIYLESDSSLDVIVNGVAVGSIEPFIINNAMYPSFPPKIIPGPFLMKSAVWSLSITNNGINPANVYFAAVE